VDQVFALLQSLFPIVASFIGSNLGVEVPVVIVACAVYLAFNDALDVALVEEKAQGKATSAQLLQAIADDFCDKTALTFTAGAFVTALAAGGDFKAAFVSGLVAACGANVWNFESSTKDKLYAVITGLPLK